MRHKGATKFCKELRKRYSPEELREVMQLSPEELDVLGRIAAGKPPRNSIAILKAIELKASFAYSKPKQEVDVNGHVNVTVNITRKVDK